LDSESGKEEESSERGDSNEVEIEINDDKVEPQQDLKSVQNDSKVVQNGNATETEKMSPNETPPNI
jgi:hypothetical protein